MIKDLDFPEKNLIDEGAERACLACLMTDSTKMVEASTRLQPEDFFNLKNRYLYDIMLVLYKKDMGKAIKFDIATLMSLAAEKDKLEQFVENSGGKSYLEHLEFIKNSHIALERFDFYLSRVVDLSHKRKLYSILGDLGKEVINNKELSSEELMVKDQNKINELFTLTANYGNELGSLGNKSGEFLEEALKQKKEILGIKTMYSALDELLQGLRRGRLHIFAAPRKTGKSAFLMGIGVNTGVRQNIPTLMISTEMSDEEISFRCLANLSQVKEIRIRKGDISKEEEDRVRIAQKQMKEGKFYHVSMRSYTLEKVIGLIKKFLNNIVGYEPNGRLKDCVVIFDYIKTPKVGVTAEQLSKEHKLLGQIADGFKELCGGCDFPMVTACQTNRTGGTANSYELEWFCDVFGNIFNKSKNEMDKDQANGEYKGNQKVTIIANRGGDECHEGINFDFNRPTLSYMDLGKQNDRED